MAPLYLIGDVGATNARFAFASFIDGRVDWLYSDAWSDAQIPDFDDALQRFLTACPVEPARIAGACFGVAAPIQGRRAHFTNRAWAIDADAIAASLGGVPVLLVNDLVAAAAGIDVLAPHDLAILQAGTPQPQGPRLIIAAGTGLGMAYAIWCDGRYRLVPSEGGHTGFAPQNARQVRLFEALRGSCDRIEAEYVVCGAGIERIYDVLRRESVDMESPELRAALQRGAGPAQISRFAIERNDRLALAALDLFVDCYGTVAGDHALSVLARGGVYVAGGIAAKILPRLTNGAFIRAFNDKSSFGALAATFPVAVVTNERLGLLGALRIANDTASTSASS